MNFLNAFLSNVLDGAAASAEMKKQVNNIESLADISKYIGGLKYTGRDTLRELGIAKVLEMEFNDPSFKKEHLAGLLAAASTAFKTEENKKIAANLNYKFGRLLPGNTALPLSGTDMTGKTVSLGDFKGKYVYVAFFRSDCRVCEEQFRLIADYKRKYGSKIEFLYVSIDKDPGEVKKFLERYPKTNWPVIVTSDEKVKEDYGIVAIPLYYLITPQGTFMQSPAAEPGVDIEKVFDSILKKK
jgi:peroxiredoxin